MSAISRGWGAWMELWEAKSYAKQRLRQVAVKLQAPQLSSRFDEWARDAAAARQAARQAALELESRSLEMQLRRSRFETNQLEIIKVAHLDELRSLRERVELLSITSRDQQAKLEEDERLKGELKELRKFAAASKEAAETAEAARIAADADLLTHQQEMQELMERLLANQRKTFEEDKARMEQKVAAIEQKRGEADATADAAKEEVSTLHATLAATQTAAAQAAEKARLVLKAALTKAEQDGAMFESRISELLALAERSQQEAAQTQVATAKALQASEAKAAQVLAVTVKSFAADLEAVTARSGELEAQLAQLQETSLHGSEGSSLKAQLESLRGAQVPSEKETIERLDKELKECQKLLMAAQKALKDKTPPPQPPPPPKAKKGTSKGTSILGRIDIDESPGAPPMTEQIATALRANSARVLDLFREWDTNGDGEVSRKEFHEAMDHLGFEVPTAEVDKLFDEWDSGSEGSLGYKNLTKILKKSTPAPPPSKLSTKLKAAGLASTVVKTVTMTPEEKEKAKRARMGGILGDVDFDEAKPLAPQLREALQKHAIRVLDLFREWDANGDGQISKDEFQKAMPMLGMDLPVNDINDLFDQYDPDKSGVMEFAELQRMLRRQPGEGAPHAAPTAAPTR
jgi:Ca2+-binding EF-hand superfamily protein